MKINKILTFVSGIMLLLAIPSIWPYGFYQFLRWVVSVTGVFNAYCTFKMKLVEWSVTMIIVAILFNPIAPIYLDKGMWVVIDIAAAVVMFILMLKFKSSNNIEAESAPSEIQKNWDIIFGGKNPNKKTLEIRAQVLKESEEE